VTSLHYTLIALGLGLVGAVILYNFVQERRSRKQAERIFELRDEELSLSDLPEHESLPEDRIEPRIQLLDDEPGEPYVAAVDDAATGIAAQRVPAVEPAPAAVAPAPGPAMAPESPLDSAIEYVARLRYVQPTALPFAPLQDSLRRISKPIRMVGRREDGGWEPVLGHATRTYDTVELALLLADRVGPVSEVQLDTFCQRLYEFATEHGGAISCQDKAEAVARAAALDAFCAEVDMLIGLNVIPAVGADFPDGNIRGLAARHGLTEGVDGSFSLKDAAGRLQFTLTDGAPDQGDHAHGLSLLFDVPRVADGLAAFDRMTTLGLELADHLGGRLVDDGGRPVSRASLDRDRKSLETIYARMAAYGIPAGSERALRLFA
jgi:hypothetical protein